MLSASTSPITPWPLPSAAHDVLLVGGTFDPPHTAHITLPNLLRNHSFPALWLLFIPAAWSPLKSGTPHTPPQHRIAMLRLAIQSIPNADLWTDELDRHAATQSPSYTIDTILRAKSIAPNTNLRLLIGADQAIQFHRWHRFREILPLAHPIVMLRDPCPTRESLRDALFATRQWSDTEVDQWTHWCAPSLPLTDVSASEIRAALHAGRPARSLPSLDPNVANYIEKHHLYAPHP